MSAGGYAAIRIVSCLAATAAASVAGLALGACGTSTTRARVASADSGARTTSTSSSTTEQTESCRQVGTPAPRSAQHIRAPTHALNPARRYVVTLATNCGAIAIQLDVRQAPRTTASFAYLVGRGFYDDLTFHRVAAHFVIQGGDPSGDGSGGPGYTIVERPPASVRYTRGTVAMAKAGTDPAGASGSQFFIVTARDAELPAQYALVGNVVGSMGVVEAIGELPTIPPQDGEPIHSVVISRATMSES